MQSTTTLLQQSEAGHDKINHGGGSNRSRARGPRASTSANGSSSQYSPYSPLNPRRNSLSEMTFEDAKSTLLSTTSGVLVPTETESTWHSIPLAFALLPAIAGTIFTNGESLTTDVLLLSLVAIFLHWFVKFPWEWYQNSKQMRRDAEALEELDRKEKKVSGQSSSEKEADMDPITLQKRQEANEELERNETYALICCFLGPLFGGWMLYAIRAQLSRPSGGLISNFNLNVFMLAAELRPCAELVRLIRDRNSYLQSMAHRPPPSKYEVLESKMEALQAQFRDLTALTAKAIERDADVDALNRAVRRYEKKDALQTIQTEARLVEFDTRLNDVLTLAAAATIRQNQPSVTGMLFEYMCSALVAPFNITWKVLAVPRQVLVKCSEIGALSFKPRLLLKEGSHSPGKRKEKSKVNTKGGLKPRGAN